MDFTNDAETSPWQTSPGPVRTAPELTSADNEASTADASNLLQAAVNGDLDEPETPTAAATTIESPTRQVATGSVPKSMSYSIQDMRFQGPPMTEEEIQQEQSRQQKLHERRQQLLHSQQQQRGPRAQDNAPQTGGSYVLNAKIIALERANKKEPAIHFDVQVRNIKRTHSEFVKLADHLISSNPEAMVPAVPPALSSAGAGTEEDETRTRNALQRWLNIVCGNDVLMRDDEMVLFVESDVGYSPVMRMKQPATGVRRKVIKQFAPPPDDTPELRDARPVVKAFYIGAMETGQKLDRLVKARRRTADSIRDIYKLNIGTRNLTDSALGTAEADLGVKFGNMHVQETHPGLGLAYKKLGKTIQTGGDYQVAQGTAESTTLGDCLSYHSADARIVKETLTNRHILLRDLISAQQVTRNKLAAADRLKVSSSVRREKVDEAISQLDEARVHEQQLNQKTMRVTGNLLQEKRRWFTRTAADVRTSIREYVLREIEAERRALAVLESVRPDVRNIDASGGLSRLGREGHPQIRRPSTQVSQGPKADAWSGVPRREGALERSLSGLSAAPGDAGVTEEAPTGRPGSLRGIIEEDGDADRVDARNAASRLANSTF